MENLVGVQAFIDGLTNFAKKEFPVHEVTSYFHNQQVDPVDLARYTSFAPDSYTRSVIHRNNDFMLLALGWAPGTGSPVHGHEGQKCWLRVEQGTLCFSNYKEKEPEGPHLDHVSTVMGPAGFVDGPAYIHAVENCGQNPAVSLHLYAYPFDSCDVYCLESGTKKKVSF